MLRFTSRQLAIALVLAASASMTSSLAGDVLISSAVPTSPPKEYVIPKKGVPDFIRKAVENPARRKEDVARDGYRKPAEVLALTGIRPGSKVVELGSFGELDKFGQYYTTLLADIVGPKGMVYMFDPPDIDEQFGGNSRIFAAAHPNTKYTAIDFNKIEFPRGIDIVICVLFYHEMLARGADMTSFQDKLYKALKPGGIYLIIDHAGTIGEDAKKTIPLHRIDPSYIGQGVIATGFEMVGGQGGKAADPLRLLERNDDDHKWSVYTEGKADQTDQAVYVFRKPVVPQN